jgi:Uma2 family endonuclease
VVQTPIKTITLDEFLKLPETKPASEYIDGQVIQKPMPQEQHSIIQSRLGMELTLILERQGIAIIFPEMFVASQNLEKCYEPLVLFL